jgi:hypothetical protein
MPIFKDVSHFDLTVNDAERSAAWYRQVLELDQLHSTDSPDTFEGRMINLVHSTGLIISVIQHEHGEPGVFSLNFALVSTTSPSPSTPAATWRTGSRTSTCSA